MSNISSDMSLSLLKTLLFNVESGAVRVESSEYLALQELVTQMELEKREEEQAAERYSAWRANERALVQEAIKVSPKPSKYTSSKEKACLIVFKDKVLNREFDCIQGVSEHLLASDYFNSLSPNSLFCYDDNTIAKKIVKEDGSIAIARHKLTTKNSFTTLRYILALRDCVMELYKLEKTDVSGSELEECRTQLNDLYDAFVAKYGYISLPKNIKLFVDDPACELIKSLEVIEHSLEHIKTSVFDEEYSIKINNSHTKQVSKYNKATVFSSRVFQSIKNESVVHNIQDAFLTSFNQLGLVDLKAIAELSSCDIDLVRKEIEENNLAYFNPATNSYELAAYYLSGNVKKKLIEVENAIANNPSLEKNKEALLKVLPQDIDMVDIHLSLSSPWLPPHVIEDFIEGNFPYISINVIYLQELGTWKITRFNVQSNLNSWNISADELKFVIKCMITQKPIVANSHNKSEQQKHSKTDVLLKVADDIHRMFVEWIWASSKNKQGLTRIYNDLYNTNVVPKYDSINYQLQGKSQAITLRKHQEDAIYRSIIEGTALFDHVVGAGKTFVAIGSIIESKRLGRFKKPLLVVPNHLLEQWKLAFYQLYPDSQILVVQSEDLSRKNIENLYYKIATSNYDAIIIKHSALTKFMIPTEFELSILEEQLSGYKCCVDKAEKNRSNKLGKKQDNYSFMSSRQSQEVIDKYYKKSEGNRAYLAEKLEEDAKAITLADLKIDALFVDEAHEFKSLAFETSFGRIIGIGNPEGSFAAMDLFLKCRYIQEMNNGKNVFFFTGTPITNSISEVFHMQRFMQYRELESKGLTHFDAWASVFGRVTSTTSLDALGINYKTENRFDRFNNLAELISMYRTFADVITKNDLEQELAKLEVKSSVPQLKHGKPVESISERTEYQEAFMHKLVVRMDSLSIRKGCPTAKKDNVLKIVGDARKASLDMRIIDSENLDIPYTKINKCVEKVFEVWTKTLVEKGTQLVFCDFSIPNSKAAQLTDKSSIAQVGYENNNSISEVVNAYLDNDYVQTKFSVYEELRIKLIALGIPQEEIAFIHHANSNAEKAALFENVNNGVVRVLVGSTKKMGTGMNVQKRLVAAHHIDVPWRPSDLEQRNGRILRQGNIFAENRAENRAESGNDFKVEIIYYLTESMYDSRMWQILEYKTLAIEQFRKGELFQRTIDEFQTDSITASEMKALATGNPLALEEIQLRTERMRLEALYLHHIKAQNEMEIRLETLKYSKSKLEFEEKMYIHNIELRDSNTKITNKNNKTTLEFEFISLEKKVLAKKDMQVVAKIFNSALQESTDTPGQYIPLGTYRGFELNMQFQDLAGIQHVQFFFVNQQNKRYSSDTVRFSYNDFLQNKMSLESLFLRFNNLLRTTFDKRILNAREVYEAESKELEFISNAIHKDFPYMKELEQIRLDHETILEELNNKKV